MVFKSEFYKIWFLIPISLQPNVRENFVEFVNFVMVIN